MRLPWNSKPSDETASDPPNLRATTDAGDAYDDPSEDLLFMLMDELVERDGSFLVVERTADPAGQTYVQTVPEGDGTWLVEYCDGSPAHHFQAKATDLRLAHSVVSRWAFGVEGWREALTWEPLKL